MDAIQKFYQDNKTGINWTLFVLIILFAWMFMSSFIKFIFRTKEKYEQVNPNPAQYYNKQQLGQTDVNSQLMNLIGAEAAAQINVSGDITKQMEQIQNEQIHNNDVNQNSQQTQMNNQIISTVKMNSIALGGLTKRGGLSELDSNILAATNSYKFDKGQLPPAYEKIFDQKQNTTSSIINSTVILNPSKSAV